MVGGKNKKGETDELQERMMVGGYVHKKQSLESEKKTVGLLNQLVDSNFAFYFISESLN